MSAAKILCPIDFSPCSARAAEHTRELAAALGAEVELIHVYEVPVLALPEGPITVSPEYLATLTGRAQEELDKQRDAMLARGIRVNTRLEEGLAAQTIVDRAKKIGATMIVMGTHGHTGFRHMLLGSVAERVVRTSQVPVLTVRTDEKAKAKAK